MLQRGINLGLLAGVFGGTLACSHEVQSPKLDVTAVQPNLLCNAQRVHSETSVLINGSGFAPLPTNVLAEPAVLQLPSVELVRSGDLGGGAASDAPVLFSGDPNGERAGHLSWQSRGQLSLRITEADAATSTPGVELAAGLFDVRVQNPDGSTVRQLDRSLAVIEPPSISELAVADSSVRTPNAVCTDQASRRLALSGTNFLSINGAAPQVTLSGQAAADVATSGCSDIPGTFGGGQAALCDALSVTLHPGELAPGTHALVVTSREPAECQSSEPTQLVVVPPPLVSSVAPAAICIDQNAQLMTVEGGSFAVVAGSVRPTITVADAGGNETTFQPDSVTGCAPPSGADATFGLELCDGLTFTLPTGQFDPGTYSLRVTNPDPIGCSSTTPVDFTINSPPRVASVAPGSVCSGGSRLVAAGEHFTAGATAQLACDGGTVLSSLSTEANTAGTSLSMTFGPGVEPGQSCELIVQNPDGCQDRPLPHQVVVGTEGPVLFNVDPHVVYNDIDTKVTLYVTALSEPFTVSMWPSGGDLSAAIELTAALAPGETQQIQATIPSGSAAGEYDMAVNDASGCLAIMESAISITDNLAIADGVVTPSFGDESASQAITIQLASAPSGSDTPRGFLNPVGADEAAVQLQSVTRLDATTLTAVVPAGTPIGAYDLVLVWPDGAVAVIDAAFTAMDGAPPVIADVLPQSIVNGSGQTLELRGTGFSGSEVSLRCQTSGGEVAIAAVADPETCTESCSQTATVNATSLASGDVCVARLTNADGSYAEFSAIGITNSSYNLSTPRPGPALNVARRALASAAVRANSASRFVYAIGGDTGDVSGALDSVEFAAVDVFGNMSPWATSARALPAARSFAAHTSIGRYVYAFGGNGGSGALSSGVRALVLSPEEAPELANVDLCLGGGSNDCFGVTDVGDGLEAGTYSYRVAALIDANDPHNLGGETLASDPMILRLRGVESRSIVVKLGWTSPKDALGAELSGITGYRVYRTPKDGTPGSGEQLLAEVNASTFELVDDGSATLTTAQPLPLGSTSAWQALPVLNAAREGASGVAARDPLDPDTWYVYALLGRDGSTGLTTYEYLDVSLAPNGRQTIGTAWTTGAEVSAVGRWQHGAWAIDSVDSSFVSGGDTYIYLGAGLEANGTTLNGAVEAGLVTSGGELSAFADDTTAGDVVKDFSATRVGYGTAGAANSLFVFGGRQGADQMMSNATAARFVDPAPGLSNDAWNNEGLSMTSERYLMGSSVESAFIFLIAGETSSGVTASTESVVW